MATTITAGNATNGLAFSADNTGALEFKTGTGAGTTALSISATGNVSGVIKSGTVVASTSGTSIDFTGIPSTAKRITVMFSGVSTSGTSVPLLRLGTSSGIEATGYLGSTSNIVTGSSPTSLNTTGLGLAQAIDAGALYSGQIVIAVLNANLWVMSATLSRSDVALTTVASSSKTLTGVLDRVRITTGNGTDTFDAGSINILYE